MNATEGRPPPHDLDAETAVLSAVMFVGRDALDEVSDELSPDDFYADRHRRIFDAALMAREDGGVVDIVTVAERLRATQRVEQVGGVAYLREILGAAPAMSTKALRRYAEVVASKRRQRDLIRSCQRAAAQLYAGVEDAKEFLSAFEAEVREIATVRERSAMVHLSQPLVEAYEEMRAQHDRGVQATGVPTGFVDIDDATGGLHEGDLTVVAGRPGMGKTSFVMNMAEHVADAGYAVIVYSLEMPRKQLAQRMMCSRAPANLRAARTASLDPNDWNRITRAIKELEGLGIYVDDTPKATISDVRTKTRRQLLDCQRAGKRVGLVAVDHLHIMGVRDIDRRDIALGEVTKGLKAMAKEFVVPVVLLAQLNRGVEQRGDKRPMLSDLRDSGSIEEDADNIAFLYRDEYYNPNSEHKGTAEFILAKQRNGETGTKRLAFRPELTRFHNLERTS